MSKPDTNQASEEELDKALGYMTIVWDESGVFGQPPDYSHVYLTGKQEVKEAILDLIHNEKLKLLAEVRERVVGEDEDTQKWEDHIDRQVADECNQLRAEMRTILTKLEAEL